MACSRCDILPSLQAGDSYCARAGKTSPQRQSVLRALVGIARDLGIQVLAEGIETQGELAYVAGQGAQLVQGYLFARPAPQPPEPQWPAF